MSGWRGWLGLALVVLGLVRAGLVVFGGPLAGYGNQYDMHRTGACLGLFPAIEAPRDTQATPEAPIDLYRKHPVQGAGACYLSTEVLIASAVAATANALDLDPSHFRLRWMGAAKFTLLALAALLIALALRQHVAASIAHGAIFLLVIADPAVTLWFNTLYTEFAILWGLYVSIASLHALAIGARLAPVLWLMVVTALATLAFSREQFALLPPALVIAAGPWLARSSPSPYVLALGVSVVASMVSFGLLPRPVAISEANRADTYLGVVLPAAGDSGKGLKTLRLPERCAPMIGASWYLQRGEDVRVACPEVLRLPSTAFLRFAPDEPEVLARSLARVLPSMQAVAPPFLGTLAGSQRVEIGELPAWRGSLLHAAASMMSFEVFAAIVAATALAAFVGALVALVRLVMRRPMGGGPLAAMLLGGTVIYAALTTVFGDGGSEAARHFLAGWLACAAGVIGLVAGITVTILRARREPRTLAWPVPVSLLVVGLGAWGAVAAYRWMQSQPLAIGVVEEPAGRATVPASTLVVHGWALEPFGVQKVEVSLGDVRRAASPDPKASLPEPKFPGYPDNGRARFRAEFTAEEWTRATAEGPALLRTTVVNRLGTASEVDRRTIDRAREPQAASAITPTIEAATK